MNVLLIGYYHLADGFKGAMDSLTQNTGGTVEFFPLSAYGDSYGENRFIYLDKFIKRQLKSTEICIGTIYNPRSKIDLILWWNFNIEYDNLSKIKKNSKDIIHSFYSWDDPYWTELCQSNKNFELIDVAMTCCADSIEFYERNGCQNVVYAMPGFDKNIHHPTEQNEEYDCDVSIVCTNLYNTNNEGKCINRYKFLRDIIKDGSIDLRVYGPEKLSSYFPKNYAGFVSFEDSHKIFARSRINICTHIRNGSKYINERTCQILGSRGLLYISDQKDLDQLLDTNRHCVIINEQDHVNQIKQILNNYESFEIIKQQGYEHAVNHMTWDEWSKSLLNGIGLFLHKKSMQIGTANSSQTMITFQKELPLIDGNVVKSLYLLCKLIRTTNISNRNYILVLDKLIKKYNIDINDFLNHNMSYLLSEKVIVN